MNKTPKVSVIITTDHWKKGRRNQETFESLFEGKCYLRSVMNYPFIGQHFWPQEALACPVFSAVENSAGIYRLWSVS